ncbi:MAG: hypothetical protein A3B13_00400 [Candidatus Liptonbacteria bacterium RIFCSPLOWO2_01_FULL_45_15]|uniref:Uncharacterized protein n=1 Tax=Candidatus Liptonbacteria bacterium RIFCSPLOWO2_01_FULL_45_15 TaxID=1798649 RepID=A0A1G2CJ75_9BACT|nr:MAG: hypothetical protein A3B13_00400 [Candidatus Liptonbacteria bacterium RIFCSPLOWO2_01_FULL_45_15]
MNTQPQLAQASAAPAESFFRDIGGIVIKLPGLPRPTFDDEHHGLEDASPVDPVELLIGTVIQEGEQYRIDSAEYARRIVSIGGIFGGLQQAIFLVENQDSRPEFVKIFKKVYEDEPVVYSRPYMDFLGFIRRTKDGNRFCPRIGITYAERLFLGWTWLDRGCRISGYIAVARPLVHVIAR